MTQGLFQSVSRMNSTLVDLAREGSSDKRRELLQQVSELFVDGAEAHSDREAMLFGDVLSRLLEQVPVEARVQLSERVAPLAQTPRNLALKLANDESSVAAPVLTHSPVLTDDDLIDVARKQGQDHLKAISMRSTLSASVTDVIVDRGNAEVLNTIARNLGAEFSEVGFATLAEKAVADTDLGEALSRRADVPPAVAATLVARLNVAARAHLEQLMSDDHDKLDSVLDKARRQFDVVRADQRRNRLETKLLIADVRAGKKTIDAALDHLVMNRRLLDVAMLLSELAGVPEAHVNNVLHKFNSMGIAVICRSLDVSETTYGRLAEVRCERLRINTAQAAPMVREYAGIDRATADRTLRFHKVRSSVGAKAS